MTGSVRETTGGCLEYTSPNGVRVEVVPRNAIYIHDDLGEIVMWNTDEVEEEAEIFTAIANAVCIAFTLGGDALRRAINHPVQREDDHDICPECEHYLRNCTCPAADPFEEDTDAQS